MKKKRGDLIVIGVYWMILDRDFDLIVETRIYCYIGVETVKLT